MTRSVPQIVSVAAVAIGVVLFVVTLYYIDLDETVESARRLGFALPVILHPRRSLASAAHLGLVRRLPR